MPNNESILFCEQLLKVDVREREHLIQQLHLAPHRQIIEQFLGSHAVHPDIVCTKAMNTVHLDAVYHTRSLAYQYIREGFLQGCDKVLLGYLRTIGSDNLCRYLSTRIRSAFTYDGQDIIDCLQRDSMINDHTFRIIHRYVLSQNAADAVKLVEKWTGNGMVRF